MRQLLVGLPLLLVLVACGSAVAVPAPVTASSAAATSPTDASPVSGPMATSSPSPRATPGGLPSSFAVLVDLTSSADSYTVSLVDAEGAVARQFVGRKRTALNAAAGQAILLPYVSTTQDSLYYLDGDSRVVGMRTNALPPQVAILDVPSGSEAAFAVSPDDSQIAVSVLDFTKSPVHVTLYTDSLAGGHRKVIFESSTDYVWPVAWHSGLLVLAHAYGPFEEDIAKAAPARGNPYSAVSYHVVDPRTANRQVLMGACTVSGPLSPAGSGCIQGGAIDWQGNTAPWSTSDWGARSSAAALSPDGQWVAATVPDNPTEMGIWRNDGTIVNRVGGPGLHDWAGWIDGETIITGSEGSSWQPLVGNVIRGGTLHPVAAHGFFAALFPTDIV